MKRLRWLVGISCIIFLACACIIVFEPKEIKVDRVYGYGKNINDYSISISPAGEKMIPSSLEHYSEVRGAAATNIAYTVVYEQSKWFKKDQHIVKLLRFERPFPTDQNEKVKIFYHLLVDESIDVLNESTSIFTRLYEKREAYNNLFDVMPQSIVIPDIVDIKEARLWLQQHNPQSLYLKDKTIIDATVLYSWEQDGYDQLYSDTSPEGLSLYDIIEHSP